jgi:peptide-methionine (S)-S-oxide reductase
VYRSPVQRGKRSTQCRKWLQRGHSHEPKLSGGLRGKTGHAEVIQIMFNPEVISYADLVRLHLASHDPTTLNQQGADKGTQYRSVILTHDAEQERIAKQIITDVQPLFGNQIVTEGETLHGPRLPWN